MKERVNWFDIISVNTENRAIWFYYRKWVGGEEQMGKLKSNEESATWDSLSEKTLTLQVIEWYHDINKGNYCDGEQAHTLECHHRWKLCFLRATYEKHVIFSTICKFTIFTFLNLLRIAKTPWNINNFKRSMIRLFLLHHQPSSDTARRF